MSLIAIACEGCGDRFGSAGAYETHRPEGACLPREDRALAGLAERVHRDRSGHGQDGIRYWATDRQPDLTECVAVLAEAMGVSRDGAERLRKRSA